jgi:transposase InsO family protein
MTDITEHPTREGKVYCCCCVLDASRRRVVGWSLDRRPTTAMVNSALAMAVESRLPPNGATVHSDHGSQDVNDRGRRSTQPLRGWFVSLCPSPPAALRLSKPRTRLERRFVAAIDVLVPFTYPWRLTGAPGTAIRGSAPYALAPSAIAAFVA